MPRTQPRRVISNVFLKTPFQKINVICIVDSLRSVKNRIMYMYCVISTDIVFCDLMFYISKQVVVKPFGPAWNSCKGVSFHDTNDITGVLQSVLDLLTVINLGDGVLVQSYHATFKPVIKPGLGRHAISTDSKEHFFVIAVFNCQGDKENMYALLFSCIIMQYT